jgi:large subunit ribosomal protein L7Ae
MSGKKKTTAKAPAAAPKKDGKKDWKSEHSHLFKKAPKDFRVGRDVLAKRDLSRYVKWPRYVRIQRQRAILKKRLKVPPAINQFSKPLEKNHAQNLFKLLVKYRPETKEQKKKRLLESAKQEVKAESKEQKEANKPKVVKYGLNHVTTLIEQGKASLVVIAHDVDPVELVVWLPALCRKKEIPYCIVKGKARLGYLVHKKTASVVCLTEVKKEDQAALTQLTTNFKAQFNDNVTERRKWGGGIMGVKANHVTRYRQKLAEKEAAKAAGGSVAQPAAAATAAAAADK